jgi:hypothetical protein
MSLIAFAEKREHPKERPFSIRLDGRPDKRMTSL